MVCRVLSNNTRVMYRYIGHSHGTRAANRCGLKIERRLGLSVDKRATVERTTFSMPICLRSPFGNRSPESAAHLGTDSVR